MKRLLPLFWLYLALLPLLLLTSHYPALRGVCGLLPLALVCYAGARRGELPALLFGFAAGATRCLLDGEPVSLALLLFPAAGWIFALAAQALDLTIPGVSAMLVFCLALLDLPLETLLSAGTLPAFDWGIIIQLACAALFAEFGFPRLDRLTGTAHEDGLRRFPYQKPAERG